MSYWDNLKGIGQEIDNASGGKISDAMGKAAGDIEQAASDALGDVAGDVVDAVGAAAGPVGAEAKGMWDTIQLFRAMAKEMAGGIVYISPAYVAEKMTDRYPGQWKYILPQRKYGKCSRYSMWHFYHTWAVRMGVDYGMESYIYRAPSQNLEKAFSDAFMRISGSFCLVGPAGLGIDFVDAWGKKKGQRIVIAHLRAPGYERTSAALYYYDGAMIDYDKSKIIGADYPWRHMVDVRSWQCEQHGGHGCIPALSQAWQYAERAWKKAIVRAEEKKAEQLSMIQMAGNIGLDMATQAAHALRRPWWVELLEAPIEMIEEIF